jgi:hypothetical protein
MGKEFEAGAHDLLPNWEYFAAHSFAPRYEGTK